MTERGKDAASGKALRTELIVAAKSRDLQTFVGAGAATPEKENGKTVVSGGRRGMCRRLRKRRTAQAAGLKPGATLESLGARMHVCDGLAGARLGRRCG